MANTRYQMLYIEFSKSRKPPCQPVHYLLKLSTHANDVSLLALLFRLSLSACDNCSFCLWCLASKRKDSEPGTKSLLSNAEMMAHHPTDPVEMRRINFQTPGTKHAPKYAHTYTLGICMIKCSSKGSFHLEIKYSCS